MAYNLKRDLFVYSYVKSAVNLGDSRAAVFHVMGQHFISIFISASFIIVAREVQAGECILVIKCFYRNHFCSLVKAGHEITSD